MSGVMRSLFLVTAALAALVAGGWYVVEWMPSGAAAASITATGTPEVQAAPVPAVRPQQIRSIRLIGDRLPTTILAAQLTAEVGAQLDQEVLDADRARLRETLIGRGYWAADVGEPVVAFGDDGGAHVSYRIATGTVFHVREVRVTGDATAAELAEALTLGPGDDVSPQRLARNAELLGAYLARHGKPAQVTVETTTDRDARAVDVAFVVRKTGSTTR
jgi:outer membrane protein assembly factor BamA